MLEYVAETIASFRGGDVTRNDHFVASKILNVIQDKGMIPPIEPGRTEMDLDLGVPEWEPEDEA